MSGTRGQGRSQRSANTALARSVTQGGSSTRWNSCEPLAVFRLTIAFLIGFSACAPASATAVPAGEPAATTAAATPRPAGKATVVFLVRHAEKASDGTKDPQLTPAGQARAECLARVLKGAEVTHIYATQLQRTQNTVAPLAVLAGVQIVVVEAGDNDALVEHLDGLPPGSVAVIAGHSNTVPAIAATIAEPLSALDDKGNIPHEQYDRMVEIVRAPELSPLLVQLHYCAPSADPPAGG